ncbi:fructosamine kinase family protein [Corynebacterium mayonis]|uniref:fructosamine kinase family protein n=1 Tax=Corynebacterium mayonis TaxID=3062461 RepID=UPI003140408C
MAEVFVKQGSAPGSAAAEASCLRWLREGSDAVVEVFDVDERANTLTIERVVAVRPTRKAARRAGEELAAIHAMGAAAFGAPPDGWRGPNFIGRKEQECTAVGRWAEFFTRQRVLPFAGHAAEVGNVDRAGLRVVERACEAIEAKDEDAPVARIHGDLWSGNVLFSSQGPRFIDPAAHGGHPLTDIAMLELFGAPYFESICEGYLSRGELGAHWRQRIPVHQMHPLAVHAWTHGPAYGAALVDAARRTLELLG